MIVLPLPLFGNSDISESLVVTASGCEIGNLLNLEISCLFFVCLFMVTLIYHNFVVLTAVICATNSDVPDQIKPLVICVAFFIIIVCRKVTKKQILKKHLKPSSNFVRSVNLVHLYRDLALITNFQSSLIDFT